MFSHFLCKDRVTPFECPLPRANASINTGRPPSPRVSVPRNVDANVSENAFRCFYCRKKIPVSDTRHDMYECDAANRIFDPGLHETYGCLAKTPDLLGKMQDFAKSQSLANRNLEFVKTLGFARNA